METFSVVSRLRGAAAHVVYKASAEVDGRRRGVRLDRAVQVLDAAVPWKWSPGAKTFAPAWAFTSEGSPVAVVRSLAVQENRLCDDIGGADAIYTLVIFPEVQTDLGGGHVRREVRFALIRGIFGSESPEAPPGIRSGAVRKAVFREPRR